MAVTVLIKRKVKPGNESLLEKLYIEMGNAVMQQYGYIDGDIMKRVDAENQLLFVSRWKSVDDWSRWLVSKERMGYQEQLDALTDEYTKFEVYTPISG